jgi:hypothetical protein
MKDVVRRELLVESGPTNTSQGFVCAKADDISVKNATIDVA